MNITEVTVKFKNYGVKTVGGIETEFGYLKMHEIRFDFQIDRNAHFQLTITRNGDRVALDANEYSFFRGTIQGYLDGSNKSATMQVMPFLRRLLNKFGARLTEYVSEVPTTKKT